MSLCLNMLKVLPASNRLYYYALNIIKKNMNLSFIIGNSGYNSPKQQSLFPSLEQLIKFCKIFPLSCLSLLNIVKGGKLSFLFIVINVIYMYYCFQVL